MNTKPTAEHGKEMSIKVENIDTYKAKEELKHSPKIIQDYVKSLEFAFQKNQETLNKAIKKIQELSKNDAE